MCQSLGPCAPPASSSVPGGIPKSSYFLDPASARAAAAHGALSAPFPPHQTRCPLSPCVPPSAALLGTGLCHMDAVTTNFSQNAGTSPPTANRTAQPMGECWGSARAGQHCGTNGALARAGPVPQNDPSFAIPKIAGLCHEAFPGTTHSGGSQQQPALPLCPWHFPGLLQAPGSTPGLL